MKHAPHAPARFLLALVAAAVSGGGCDEVTGEARDLGTEDGPPAFVATPAPSGLEKTNFYGVSGSGAGNVVLVGSGGAIARWDGQRLLREDSGTTADLRGVIVVNQDLAWAAGAGGTLIRYSGQKWTVQVTGLMGIESSYFNAVWSDGAKMVAVGVKGAAVAYEGMFRAVPTDSPDDLFALTVANKTLFAVGTLGTIASYDGMAFHRSALQGYSKTLSGVTAGSSGVWLVGLGGAVYHATRSDGSDLNAVMGVPPVFLRGVAAPGQGAWVVGFDGLVARVLGKSVTVMSGLPDRWYEGVWGAADDDLWIVGNAGIILRTNRAALEVDGGSGDGGGALDGGGRG